MPYAELSYIIKMPSKNKPNAFIVYAQSIRQQLIREGHVISGTPDLVAAAGPYWKELPEDEKEYYKRLAKERGGLSAPRHAQRRPDRKDNTGQLISNRVNLDEIKQQRQFKERLEVARQWHPGKEVIHEKFFFISFSVMLDLRHLSEVEEYEKVVPCEVSIVEYSIEQGLEREIHKFIKPGVLRLGFKATAMSTSENSHKIPIEGLGDEDETYSKIYDSLCRFVMDGRRVVPPVFCKASDVEQTECALKWLSTHARKQPLLTKVYELEGLLLGIESHLMGKKPDFLGDAKATSYLNRSVYDYEKDTRCKYHEELDSKFCSLGIVKKWGFLLSDYLCPKADVQITSRHLPCISDDEIATPYVSNNRNTEQSQLPHSQPLRSQGPPMANQRQQQQQQQHPRRNDYEPVQQQHRQRATTPHQQQQELTINNSTGNSQNGNNTRPPLIGRGRGLAQILSQQRKPGEKPKEPQKLVAGRGRATTYALQASARPSQINANNTRTFEGSSAQPKPSGIDAKADRFALFNTAPPASLAPKPPSAWKVA